MSARPHFLSSVFTHSDNVFWGLPFFLMCQESASLWEIWYRMWPVVYGHTIWVANNEGLMWCPRCEVTVIMKLRAFRLCLSCHRSNRSCHSHCSRAVTARVPLGPHVSLTWSIAEQTQTTYTLSRILGERCLEVRAGKSFLNFPQATQRLEAIALPQPPPEHSISPR